MPWPKDWSTRRTGRPALRSPGQPGVSNKRARLLVFWDAVAEGLSSEDAGTRAGVSEAVATRWFREAGGMRPSTLARCPSSRFLSFTEREDIAVLNAQGYGVRQI